MLTLNGTAYRLVAIDTNVISEILRDEVGVRGSFRSRFRVGYVPCFSVYSLFELRRRPDLYEAFLDFFDEYPCMVLKNEEQLIEDELSVYPTAAGLDPTLVGFSYLNRPKGTNLRNVMEVTHKKPGFLLREKEWLTLKPKLLQGWLDLKPNYPPRGTNYRARDGFDFVRRVTIQNVEERAPDWTRARRERGLEISAEGFPSVRLTLWTLFFRLYVYKRKPVVQDVFDILLSSPAPYLDAVVTEKFQADIYRQVRRLDAAIENLDVYTLGDLRR